MQLVGMCNEQAHDSLNWEALVLAVLNASALSGRHTSNLRCRAPPPHTHTSARAQAHAHTQRYSNRGEDMPV